MIQLVDDLKTRLPENAEREFLKDIPLNRWFMGQDVEDDIVTLQEAFRQNGLGKDNVVLAAPRNLVVYILMNQAMWCCGVIAHPVVSITSIVESIADYDENQYSAVIFNQEKAVALKKNTELRYEILHLKTSPDSVLLSRKGNDNTHKEMALIEDTLGWISNTPGTTGRPKQVGLSHRFTRLTGEDDLVSHRMIKDDTVLIMMSMFHVNAQELIIVSTLLPNGRTVIVPKFSTSHFWQWIDTYHCTRNSVVSMIVTVPLKSQRSLDNFDPNHQLCFIRCVLATLPISRDREFSETFDIPVLESYGMTESCSQYTLNPIDAIKVGSVGKPYDSEVKTADGDNLTMKVGIEGEIATYEPHVIIDYLSSSPKPFRDGWLLIGDPGYYDKDGYLWLNGRGKNAIDRGGEKINPTVIKNVIGNSNPVRGAVAALLPDDICGETAVAVVVLQPDVVASTELKEEVREYCIKHLVKHERSTEIYFTEASPLNPTNKIMHPWLLRMLAEQRKVETV